MTYTSDPYRVLNVPRDAERRAIRQAYRTLAWQWHPDHGGAPEQMIQINEAWRILGHDTRRAAYDAAVSQGSQPPVRPPAAPPVEPTEAYRPPRPSPEPGVLDYGRYAGWSIARLADHDPDFLEWLVRMPSGRPYAAEIRTALERRQRQAADRAPRPAARRSFFGLRPAAAR